MLLRSRKFWIMVVDVIVSLATYFVGRYFNPEAAKDILFVIGSVQPVILAVIAAITVQNVEGIRAQATKDEAIIYNSASTDIDPEPE